MSAPLLPTSQRVAVGWLKLAVSGVVVGSRLPAADDNLRAKGFIRVPIVGGDADRYVPMRSPVAAAECWWPPLPPEAGSPWSRAEQLAQRVLHATYDGALMGREVELPGNYAQARVHTVIALSEPTEITEDPSDWARYDLDLLINWTTA